MEFKSFDSGMRCVSQLYNVNDGLAFDVDRRLEMAQAGRRWQRTLFPWLLAWVNWGARLKQSEMDSCVFSCTAAVTTPNGPRDETLLIGCYVDDLFILSSHTDEDSLYTGDSPMISLPDGM